MPKIVGIDLGTSNSCMSVMRTGQAAIIPPANDMQRRVTPSVVGYTDDGKIVVGNAARRQWMANPEFTFVGVKRLLGRRFDDPIVTQVAELSPFDVAPGPNGEAMLVGRDNQLIAPEEVLLGDLLFESPTGAWERGIYALEIEHEGGTAALPIELR